MCSYRSWPRSAMISCAGGAAGTAGAAPGTPALMPVRTDIWAGWIARVCLVAPRPAVMWLLFVMRARRKTGYSPVRPAGGQGVYAASPAPGRPGDPRSVAALQRTAGNAAVSAALRPAVPAPEQQVAVQRRVTIDDSVEMPERNAISNVLAANSVLGAMWMWLGGHSKIEFRVFREEEGFATTVAELPFDALTPGLIADEHSLSLKIRAFTGTGERRSPTSITETISHELNLHLLPWARVMMFKEFQSLDSQEKLDAYPAEQLQRIIRVLGQSGNLTTPGGQERVVRDIKGDAANKFMAPLSGEKFGNHADVGLWLLHFQTIANLAKQQPQAADQAALVAEAMGKVLMPMKLTGKPDTAVVRNLDALPKCGQVLDGFATDYGDLVADKTQFLKTLQDVKDRLAEYANSAQQAANNNQAAPYVLTGNQ